MYSYLGPISPHHLKKTFIKFGPPLKKLSGSTHDMTLSSADNPFKQFRPRSSLTFCPDLIDRALDHPILGPKFGPIPNAKKYGFFPNSRKKIPNLTFFFFFFGPIPNAKKYVFFPIRGKKFQFDKKNVFFFFFWFSIFFNHRIIEYNSTCFFLSLFS